MQLCVHVRIWLAETAFSGACLDGVYDIECDGDGGCEAELQENDKKHFARERPPNVAIPLCLRRACNTHLCWLWLHHSASASLSLRLRLSSTCMCLKVLESAKYLRFNELYDASRCTQADHLRDALMSPLCPPCCGDGRTGECTGGGGGAAACCPYRGGPDSMSPYRGGDPGGGYAPPPYCGAACPAYGPLPYGGAACPAN